MLSRSAIAPRHKNAPRPAWKCAEAFKQWLRGRSCACGGRNSFCSGKVQSAHVDYAAKGTADAKGAASKVADRWCIPLSESCHMLQHSRGWPWFDQNILKGAGSAEKMAADYFRLWPGRKAWERANG